MKNKSISKNNDRIKNNTPLTIIALPQEGFVRLPMVLQVLGISRSSFWAGIKEGRFPKPIKLGPRISAWQVDDIRQLISRLANQDVE